MRHAVLAIIALAGAAAPAAAQQTDTFVGAWALQTARYGADNDTSLSGAAVIRSVGPAAYEMQLVTNELQPNAEGGGVTTVWQRCRGERVEAQLSLTCSILEASPNYVPDDFVLTPQPEGRTLTGTLHSVTPVEVTFTRVR